MSFAIALIVIGAILILCFHIGYRAAITSMSSETASLEWYRTNYLTRQGWNTAYGGYHLQSFDGGKNWYAMEVEDTERKVLGPADEIHPGLVARLEGTSGLYEYVRQNGIDMKVAGSPFSIQ